jgi:hypothetical protein
MAGEKYSQGPKGYNAAIGQFNNRLGKYCLTSVYDCCFSDNDRCCQTQDNVPN